MTQVKKFNQFGIHTEAKGFEGEKININKVLNRKVIVHRYKIQPSKFEGKGDCLHLQIEVSGKKHVLFTGGRRLITAIEQVPKDNFPFETEIVEEEKSFFFT